MNHDIAVVGVMVAALLIGIGMGGLAAIDITNKCWRRAAHEGKEYRVGQDVYRVEYVRSEPKEWK